MRPLWLWLALSVTLWPQLYPAQREPPPKEKHSPSEKKKPDLPGRIRKIRGHLSGVDASDPTAKMLASRASSYLDKGDEQLRTGEAFAADRMAGAADALVHALEHLQHARDAANGKAAPAEEKLARGLERTYFRVLQADYFFKQSKDPQAKPFVALARQLYQKARKAYDTGETRQAEEFSKAAGEIVKALEHLAQAATPIPVPPQMK